jgi:DNA-binding XRE family transcriptional regulator
MSSNNERPEWAAKLEDLRESLGLSQAALAKKLNVSPMAPSRWERAINRPSTAIYLKLGKMAGHPRCWYFWGEAGLTKEDLVQAVPDLARYFKAVIAFNLLLFPW